MSLVCSFGAECDHGVDARGSPGWQPCREKRDGRNEEHNRTERERVPGADSVKKAAEETGSGEGSSQAEGDTHADQHHGLAYDQAENIRLGRAQGDADPYFVCALCY